MLDPYEIVARHIGQLHGLGVPQRASPQFAGQVGDAAAPAVLIGQKLHHLRYGHALLSDVGFHFVAAIFCLVSAHIYNSFPFLDSLYDIMDVLNGSSRMPQDDLSTRILGLAQVREAMNFEGSDAEKQARIYLATFGIDYDAITKEQFATIIEVLKLNMACFFVDQSCLTDTYFVLFG